MEEKAEGRSGEWLYILDGKQAMEFWQVDKHTPFSALTFAQELLFIKNLFERERAIFFPKRYVAFYAYAFSFIFSDAAQLISKHNSLWKYH